MTDEELQLVAVGPTFHLETTALTVGERQPTFEEWSEAAGKLKKVHTALAFWIGDLLNLGDTLFREESSQVIDVSYLDEKVVKDYTTVAKRVPLENRGIASWDHCKVVAFLSPAKQKEMLTKAHQEDWSPAKLKTEIASATESGKQSLRFWLIVQCGTEAKQEKLSAELEKEGYVVVKKSGVKREKKAPKPRASKKKQPVLPGVPAKKRAAKKSASKKPASALKFPKKKSKK